MTRAAVTGSIDHLSVGHQRLRTGALDGDLPFVSSEFNWPVPERAVVQRDAHRQPRRAKQPVRICPPRLQLAAQKHVRRLAFAVSSQLPNVRHQH
jgi:hypothetical protein